MCVQGQTKGEYRSLPSVLVCCVDTQRVVCNGPGLCRLFVLGQHLGGGIPVDQTCEGCGASTPGTPGSPAGFGTTLRERKVKATSPNKFLSWFWFTGQSQQIQYCILKIENI